VSKLRCQSTTGPDAMACLWFLLCMRPVVASRSSRTPFWTVARLLLMRPAPLVMKPPLRFLSAMPLRPRPPVVARMSVGCRAVLCNKYSSRTALSLYRARHRDDRCQVTQASQRL
jgi:hypothetical protein